MLKICYYYNMAIALVNTGISAGLPNVIIKSLASGTPTITTDVGVSKEYIDEKLHNGILIKPLDKNELKNGIRKVLKNENEFRDWNTDFLKNFSYHEFGEKLSLVYLELLKK